MDENLERYMNRILPVVGEHLRGKHVACYNLEWTHRIAEAFAKSGVNRFTFVESGLYMPGTQMHASYGDSIYQKANIGTVMADVIKGHNHYEDNWYFTQIPWSEDVMCDVFKSKPDVFVGASTVPGCQALAKLARTYKVPTVLFSLFPESEVISVISVIDTKRGGPEWSIFDDLPYNISSGPNNRIDLLETSDLVGLIAKALLLNDTKFERTYLGDVLYKQKRSSIIRGTREWPWWVWYGSEKSSKAMVDKVTAISRGTRSEIKPSSEEKLMVIGCGTGSLLVEEAINYFKHLHLIDCKPFSVFNPVRQYITTRLADSSDSKSFVLQEMIKSRFHRKHSFGVGSFGKYIQIGDLTVGASHLKITESDRDSIKKFEELLDMFNPTVVIVGMGQAYDDNFIATKILRDRGIKHIVPGIFPLASHYKHIVVDGKNGPCYGCFQGRLIIDTEGAAPLSEEQYDMYYGFGSYEKGTQPATIFETWPSSHSMLRLTVQLSLPAQQRDKWFTDMISNAEGCLVGANTIIKDDTGYLYGTSYPGQVVTYSEKDIVGMSKIEICEDCGREVKLSEANIFADTKPLFKL